MSTPVHQWLQNHSIFDDMQHHYQPFGVDQLASCDQQHQHQHHAQSLQTYSAYSQILDDCDKALLATIYLGPSSTDRTLTTSVTATDASVNMAASMDHMSMYEIPALPPGMEGCHPTTTWDPKHPMGHSSPLVRSMTVFPEITSSHNNNGQSNENSLVLSPYVSDNHTLHNNKFCRTATATNNSLAVNITLPDQGTSPPLPSMTQRSPHQLRQQQQQYHHHHQHQYGAADPVSATLLHLSHPYHPFSFSPSVSPPPFSGSSSPSNTLLPSIYPPTSPSLSSPSVCSSPYGSSMPATPGGPNYSHHSLFATGSEQHMSPSSWPLSGSSPSSRSLDLRSTPIMTRRRSRAFLEKQATLSSSSASSPSPSPGTMRHLSPVMTRRRSQALAQNALLVAAASIKTMTTAASSPSRTKPKPLPFARLPTSKISSNTGGGAYSTATTTSPTLLLNPSGATPSSPKALICPICKKDYANNSTLRRHLKIHAYNSTSTATRKVCTPPPPPLSGANISTTGSHNSALSSTPGSATSNHPDVTVMSSTLAAVNTHLISSFWPYRDIPASSSIMNSATPMRQIHLQSHIAAAAAAAVGGVVTPGYSPGSDPTIKKPECVGCSKPFARRDTVILHIKNQKRKWDLLCTMLPALSTSSSGNSSNTDQGASSGIAIDGDDDEDGDGGDDDDDDGEVTMMDSNGCRQIQIHTRQQRTSSLARAATSAKLVGPTHRRYVRQRRAHPFRDVEKLWQSTLQRKKIHFGAYKKPVSSSTTASTQRLGVHKSGQFIYEGDGEYGGEEFANHAKQQQQQRQQKRGGEDMDVDIMSAFMEDENDDEDEESEDEDGWPSQEVLDGMDNQTKIHWMVKMAVEPPCWSERKVRLFGAYGMVEETVLQ